MLLVLIMVLTIGSFRVGLAFNYGKLEENWLCESSGRKLGNFPPLSDYRDPRTLTPLLSPADQWTTFPVKVKATSTPVRALHGLFEYDDHKQLVSRSWQDPGTPMGFYIKPHGVGFGNRIIFQLGLSEESPIEPPYPDSSVPGSPANASTLVRFWSEYKLMWRMMKLGLFNCHVNRASNYFYGKFPPDYPTSVATDVDKALAGLSFSDHDWSSIESRYPVAGCQAGVDNPVCCYGGFSKREYRYIQKNLVGDDKDPLYEKSTFCPLKFYIDNYEKYRTQSSCQRATKNMTQAEKILFHHSTSNRRCNKHLFPSLDSCLMVDKIKENRSEVMKNDPDFVFQEYNHVFPCTASCYKAMIVQVELIPSFGHSTTTRSTTTTTTTTTSSTTTKPGNLPDFEFDFDNRQANESSTIPPTSPNSTTESVTEPIEGSDQIHVSAITIRLNRISQPPYNLSDVPRYFGYEMSTMPKSEIPWQRTDYVGTQLNLTRPFRLPSEEFTGIWIRWLDKGSNISEKSYNTQGPLLQIGLEGSSDPIAQHDFYKDPMYLGRQIEPFGFMYGWRGIELQRPFIGSVFRPRYVTINTPLLSDGFSYRSEARKCEIEASALEKGIGKLSKSTVGIVGVVFFVLGFVVVGVLVFRHMKSQKTIRKEEKAATRIKNQNIHKSGKARRHK
ncbi:hypothetical protein TCAL_14305 [Tigriopus californicus]|uniref:Uncharacterized protein n=1 Tax=Tigriopus californicus TaxID=6832 RepID=A0A553NFT4_TIGCA|nr:uncharacterized protein LOC131888077 [Tigriopus californicus]TRY64229.1 hypothetical protein TCAL_14305 [Tigriopus californicus]